MATVSEDEMDNRINNLSSNLPSLSFKKSPLTNLKPINTVSPLRMDTFLKHQTTSPLIVEADSIEQINKSPETAAKWALKSISAHSSPNSTSLLNSSTADSSSSSTNSRNNRLQDDVTRLCKKFFILNNV